MESVQRCVQRVSRVCTREARERVSQDVLQNNQQPEEVAASLFTALNIFPTEDLSRLSSSVGDPVDNPPRVESPANDGKGMKS